MVQLKKTERVVVEGSSAVYKATLKAPDDSVVTTAQISTLEMIFYNHRDGAIINSRGTLSSGGVYGFQDIKGLSGAVVNNCTFGVSDGLLTWNMQSADNTIVDTTLAVGQTEKHVAVFKFTYTSGGVHVGYHTEIFEVEQVRVI